MDQGLLIGIFIANGISSFTDSYNAAEDREGGQAESDEMRALRRAQAKRLGDDTDFDRENKNRELLLKEADRGVKYDPEANGYLPSGSGASKRDIEDARKGLQAVTGYLSTMTPDQKEGTVEGRAATKAARQAYERLSALTGGVAVPTNPTQAIQPKSQARGLIAPAAQRQQIIEQTEALGSVPSVPVDKKPVSAIGLITANPSSNSFGGFTPIKGYRSKQQQEVDKTIQTDIGKKAAISALPAEERLRSESAESKTKIGLLKDGFKATADYINNVNQGQRQRYISPKTPLVGGLISSEPIDEARMMMSEAIGRLHSGGAIGDSERQAFLSLIPTAADKEETYSRKLKQFGDLMRSKMETFGYKPEEFGLMLPEVKLAGKKSAQGNTSPKGMVTISNGKETLFVTPQDAKEAEREGFKVLK
jgi:hypothetical protein